MKERVLLIILLISLTSCKNTWSDEDKDAFYQACTEEAKPWAADKAKPYCDCVFDKMTQKYPNENDALEHLDTLGKDPDLLHCRQEVLQAAKH